jgi:LDH2 family malate/lactate/ureidoglycolate dehydrogenase
MTTASTARFDANELERFATLLLRHAGLDDDKAGAVASVLVEGDLLGHDTHGLQLLPTYLAELGAGRMTASGEPEVLADAGVVQAWDGKRLPGPWLTLRAIDVATRSARAHGTGIVNIRRSHHIAALAPYARRVAEQGLLLQLMSSAPAGGSVAPFGGTKALFSPSPIGVGIPTTGAPVLVDVSTSITTNGLTGRLAREGRKLPGAWLIDEHGAPTDDPAVLVAPRTGTILPLGGTDTGHKGYGLSLMVEAFTAGLAGQGRSDPGARWGATVFVQVLDPAFFNGEDALREQMDWIAQQCRANPPVRDGAPVRLPGERAQQLLAAQRAHGVEIASPVLDALAPWAQSAGVTLPATR